MEEADPRQQLETFKQNDAYRQLLTFTEVKDALLKIKNCREEALC